MGLLIRLAIKAVAIFYLLPLVPGITIHGGFGTAFVLAVFFSLMLWGVEVLAATLAAIWAVTTFGVALLFIIPLWIFGFWILPAFALKVVADLMPYSLTVSGWSPAAWGGLILLFVGMLTGGFTRWNSTVRGTSTV
jgi:uncharacterized membrane protein YvlD (DUF360 family)